MRNIVRRHDPALVLSKRTGPTSACLSALLAAHLLAGCPLQIPPHPGNPEPLAPLVNDGIATQIPEEYLVVFKPGTSSDAASALQDQTMRLGGTIRHVYRSALMGFSARMSPEARDHLRKGANVAFIEANQNGSPDTVQDFSSPDPNWPAGRWPTGLARTSKRLLPLERQYTYSEDGSGVHVYVIDTGIKAGHREFGTRVSGGANVTGSSSDTDDCLGHGTFMAGIIGGQGVGIAKGATLHPVRATTNCKDYPLDNFVKAINWVIDDVNMNNYRPAVINFSYSFLQSDTLDNAVTNAINNGITVVVSAGNHNGADACGVSPARVSNAITVGAVNPENDTRSSLSNIGTCLDLFAPGENILSAGIGSNDPYVFTNNAGTSSAAAHVTGVVARYLQTHPTATPAQVWSALHLANNQLGTTANWKGVTNPGTNSPNEMLHYGSRNNGQDDGDPHITTVNNIYYHFQVPGEFVALRDGNGMEIQTRQTPVKATPWVSINTAIAARVGTHRVTWQPSSNNDSGRCSATDPYQLELRIDGQCATIPANGLDLGNGGFLMKSVDGTRLDVTFPDETRLVVTSHWWPAQNQWFLNLSIFNTPATEGIMGVLRQGSWEAEDFVETWRVSPRTSLFDYPPGLSTETYSGPIVPQGQIPPPSLENKALAQRVCTVEDQNLREGCRLDVEVTGDPIFAESARIQELIKRKGYDMFGHPPKPHPRTEMLSETVRELDIH